MDKDHRPLPRFADIQPRQSDRISRDENPSQERYNTSSDRVDHLGARGPRPLHPPVRRHAVRTDLFYQQSSATHHPSGYGQISQQHLPERQVRSPIPAYSQPIQTLSDSDRDRAAHSQSPSVENMSHTAPTIHYASYKRPQQLQQVAVAEGGVTKPKKLHREVEQKRRMRMAEQIVELRKWVSDPNGGRTDKVSVLQDAVTYVKESARKIEELKAALERSDAECAHLRSLVNKSSMRSNLQPTLPQMHAQSHLAPISHLSNTIRNPISGTFDESGRPSSQLTGMPTVYQERQVYQSTAHEPGSHGNIATTAGPPNFVVAQDSATVMGIRSFGEPRAQTDPNRSNLHPAPSSVMPSSLELPGLQGQPGLHARYYGTNHEAGRAGIGAPPQRSYRPGQTFYESGSLPKASSGGRSATNK